MVGAGRLGTSLALALLQAGATCTGYVCRTERGTTAAARHLGPLAAPDLPSLLDTGPGLLLLTVPDDALEAVAAETGRLLGSRPPSSHDLVVLHTSGATSLSILNPCAQAGADILAFHPLQTFADPTSGPARFRGVAIALSPGNDAARAMGERLASALGANAFLLSDEHRALYHAAASVASNYLVALVDAATQLFERAGLGDGAALQGVLPLLQGTLDNLAAARSTAGALTGPLSRGDLHTVQAHLEALAREAPDALPLYRLLGSRTLDIVRRQRRLPVGAIERLQSVLDHPAAPPSSSE